LQLPVKNDSATAPHIRNAPDEVLIPGGRLKTWFQVVQVAQPLVPHGSEKRILAHRPHQVGAGEYDVPASVAGERPGEQLLVALIDAVADGHSELPLEVRNGIRRDVVRPVVDVQPAAYGARASRDARQAQEEQAAVHCRRLCKRSETSTSAPKKTTISAEIALIAGFAPRRAVA